MATRLLYQTTIEEKLIWFALIMTFPCYLLGCLYILGSVLGWLLFSLALLRAYVEGDNIFRQVPAAIWFWVLGMIAMLVALLVAHIDRQLGTAQTIKSSIGWAKGWALLALFPMLGAMVPVRQDIITRGVCVLAACAIPFAFTGVILSFTGFSGDLYLSPFVIVGGPLELFQVKLYGINPETGSARWPFIGPWAPAAGLISCLCLLICWQEKNIHIKTLGIAGCFTMCILCQSRAGWAIFIVLIPALIGLRHITNVWLLFLIGLILPGILLLGQPIIDWLYDSYIQVKESRPGSTRVRSDLAEIALQRWQSEAFYWGHGIVELGPKSVERMPIGTHHTWYGLLFVKGIIGALALGLPFAFSLIQLLLNMTKNAVTQTALLISTVLFGYSFFENLEVLSYLYWPALFWLGIALKQCTFTHYADKNINKTYRGHAHAVI